MPMAIPAPSARARLNEHHRSPLAKLVVPSIGSTYQTGRPGAKGRVLELFAHYGVVGEALAEHVAHQALDGEVGRGDPVGHTVL